MVTETVVQAVYRTSCDRCHAAYPESYDARAQWQTLDRRKVGAPQPQADLCLRCSLELEQFLDGKAVPDARQ